MIFNKKLKLIPVILYVFFCSCNSDKEIKSAPENKSVSDSTITSTTAEKIISFNIFMNDSTDKSAGFGYEILMNKQRYIRQSTIPAVSGNQYFKTEAEAKIAASFVCYKIQNNIMPPTVSTHELDSLGITIK